VRVRAGHKPSSVFRIGHPLRNNDHSSLGISCPIPLATNPEARAGHPQALPYLVLLQVGFTKLPQSPEELVRSYRTFSPLPCQFFTRRYLFCGTFLRVATTPRYGAPCPPELGLSSRIASKQLKTRAIVWPALTQAEKLLDCIHVKNWVWLYYASHKKHATFFPKSPVSKGGHCLGNPPVRV